MFLSIVQAVKEVLNKSQFSLQMGNCPIPVAKHSGLFQNDFLKDSNFLELYLTESLKLLLRMIVGIRIYIQINTIIRQYKRLTLVFKVFSQFRFTHVKVTEFSVHEFLPPSVRIFSKTRTTRFPTIFPPSVLRTIQRS